MFLPTQFTKKKKKLKEKWKRRGRHWSRWVKGNALWLTEFSFCAPQTGTPSIFESSDIRDFSNHYTTGIIRNHKLFWPLFTSQAAIRRVSIKPHTISSRHQSCRVSSPGSVSAALALCTCACVITHSQIWTPAMCTYGNYAHLIHVSPWRKTSRVRIWLLMDSFNDVLFDLIACIYVTGWLCLCAGCVMTSQRGPKAQIQAV